MNDHFTLIPVDSNPFEDEHIMSHPDELLTDSPQDVPSKKDSWGQHLLVDMSETDNKIKSKKQIDEFFHELILDKLKMEILSDTVFKEVNDRKEGHGISGMIMLTTSHVSLHADDNHNKVFLDVFSCRYFEKEPVLKYIYEYFKPKRMAYREVFRDAGPGRQ